MRLETFFENFELFAETPGAVAKMRELILQLAAHGKLVEQTREDEPASALVWRIERHFEALRSRKELRGSSIEPLGRKELPEIPASWEWVRLGNVVDYGSSDKSESAEIPEDAWLLDLEDIEKDTSKLLRKKAFRESPSKSTKTAFAIGDVLYGKLRPYLNKVLVADASGYCTTEIVPIRAFGFIEPTYLCYALKRSEFITYANSKSYGMNLPRLGTEDARSAPFPLPPLAEQKRIVAKVDELMALCDRLEEQQQERQTRHAALARASLSRFAEAPTPANLDFLFHDAYAIDPADLRKSILTLAVQGKLVRQDPKDERVEDSLARNDECRRETARGDHRADEENQPLLSGDDRWDIADTWSWRGLADLVLFVDYRGKTPAKLSSGVRLLTAKNVRKGQINLSPEEFLSETEFHAWMTRGFPRAGDVLFTTEAPMGNAAVVELSERFALAQRVICFQSYGALDPAFLVLQILSDQFQFFLDNNGTGVTAKGIKASKLKQLPIAIAPLAEQRRIVAKVDQLMALVDQLEEKLAAANVAGTELLDAAIHELIDPRPVEPAALRIAVGCHIVQRMAGKRYFGRTANMKALYLAQAHIGLDLGVHPMREAAGPFDPWIYQFERKAAEEHWFETVENETGNGNRKVEYRPGPALSSQAKLADTWLTSEQHTELDRLLGLLADKTTEEAEIIATLFAAWNDALIDGLTPSDDDIIREVRDNWHVSKQRFGHTRLNGWLDWMRRNRLVPQGLAPRTSHQESLLSI